MKENMKDLIFKSMLIANFMVDEESEQRTEDRNISMYLFVIKHSIQILSKGVLDDDDKLFIDSIPNVKFLLGEGETNSSSMCFVSAVNALIDAVDSDSVNDELIYWSVVTFFAQNSSLKPLNKKKITAANKKELLRIYDDLNSYAYNSKLELIEYIINSSNKKQVDSMSVQPVNKAFLPTDAVNKNLTNLENIAKEDKEVRFSINFEALKEDSSIVIPEEINEFDVNVLNAVYSIIYSGQRRMTYRQIHKAMGYETNANTMQIRNINETIDKMSRLPVTIEREGTKVGENLVSIDREENILLIRKFPMKVNGALADAVIEVVSLLPPILMDYAIQLDQYIVCDKKMLQLPLNSSATNNLLKNYIIREIHDCKRQKTIMYKDMYEQCQATDKLTKSRLRKRAKDCFEFLVAEGFIKNYSEVKDGIKLKK